MLAGQPFFSYLVDALFLCGAFSLPVVLLGLVMPGPLHAEGLASHLVLPALANFAHFAASTVRLYTKPGTTASHPFVAWTLPLVFLGAVVAGMLAPGTVGNHFNALYLTWSPYHYAAQAYGLALLYCYRSQVRLTAGEKRALWWICMLPFLRTMLNLHDTSIVDTMGVDAGIRWLVPGSVLQLSAVTSLLSWAVTVLAPLAFIVPLVFALYGRTRLPVLALVLILFNALWLVAFSQLIGATLATVAHSIQYLFIVTWVHTADSTRTVDPSRGPLYHALSFYALSVVGGLALFFVAPVVIGTTAGLMGLPVDAPQCVLMVSVAINLHHFIVDGYIWRSRAPAPASAIQFAAPSVADQSRGLVH